MNLSDTLRKYASIERGRRVFEGPVPPAEIDAVSMTLLQKASCADYELLKIAAELAGDGENILDMYERLGGTFSKEAIGAPMFSGAPILKPPTASQKMGTTPTGIMAPPKLPQISQVGIQNQGQMQTPQVGTTGVEQSQ